MEIIYCRLKCVGIIYFKLKYTGIICFKNVYSKNEYSELIRDLSTIN
jgi:hypothetical protein